MSAIPVLIVDDEYLIRSLVRNSVDWEALGCSVVGEAEDGEEALRLVEELSPRLAIVDINIPFINGLDLSFRLKASRPDLRVIILTGYEDFHFARAAIKVGVVDYLLKPIDAEELSRAVRAARDGILREEADARAVRHGAAPSKEDALRALLSGDGGPLSVLPGGAEPLGVDFGKPLVLALFAARAALDPADLKRRAALFCEVFAYREGTVVLLANEDARTARLKDKAYYEACASALAAWTDKGIPVSAGLSRPAEGAAALPAAYAQALSALDDAFYFGPGLVHAYEDRPPPPESALPVLPPRASLLMLLRGGESREFSALARGLFRELGKARAPRGYCEMLCLELVLVVSEFLKELGLSVNELLGTDADLYRLVRERVTLADMEEWLAELVSRGAAAGEASGGTRTRQVVRKAKAFIERSYARKQLTLDSVAEQAAVGASYLSSVFKKELGVSLIEFLTDTRLDAAKRLLDADPLATVIEVSDRVGYSDPYYFSKCFRRRFGASPTAYLRRRDGPRAD